MESASSPEGGAGSEQAYQDAIATQREIINNADAELIPLLQRRAEAAKQIGAIKADHGLPVFVGAREQEVLDQAQATNGQDSALSAESVEEVMRIVMKTSRAAQQGLADHGDHVVTGFRPTSDLTVGNYLGAIRPALEIQNDPTKELYFFVADIHGLTDTDPREIASYRHAVVHDLLALGIDPRHATLYMQSDIEAPVVEIASRIGPYISVSELAGTPTIKDKTGGDVNKANYALLGYPVLMGADIFAQHADLVPVGKDQDVHLEKARDIARRFNATLKTDILVVPRNLVQESLRILGLNGKDKMSKSNPSQAIIFTDDPELTARKIQGAETATAGEMTEVLASHFLIAESLDPTDEEREKLAELKQAHMDGQPVMGEFKKVWGQVTARFLEGFQTRRAQIDEADTLSALRYGADRADRNAQETLRNMREVMGF